MQADFWHQRWAQGRIGFHQNEANLLLVKYFERLNLTKSSRVFLPLCGKSLDIGWLLDSGYHVVGVELSELAVEALFEWLDIEPQIKAAGKLKHYSAPFLDIYVGDFFDLTDMHLASVDAIYDRAALVALPKTMREQYTQHLIKISKQAAQLLITFSYEQQLMSGPPFSVDIVELERLYLKTYRLKLLESTDMPGGLRLKVVALESAWLLSPLDV